MPASIGARQRTPVTTGGHRPDPGPARPGKHVRTGTRTPLGPKPRGVPVLAPLGPTPRGVPVLAPVGDASRGPITRAGDPVEPVNPRAARRVPARGSRG